jgi:hypothetical protein
MVESNNTNTSVQFEHRDVNIRPMAWLTVAIIVTAILLHIVLYFLYEGFRIDSAESGRVLKSADQTVQETAAQPKLQVDPAQDINQLREEENRKLSTYGWVDKNKGVVRIPIEQAIRIVADRGLESTNTANAASGSTAPSRPATSKQK